MLADGSASAAFHPAHKQARSLEPNTEKCLMWEEARFFSLKRVYGLYWCKQSLCLFRHVELQANNNLADHAGCVCEEPLLTVTLLFLVYGGKQRFLHCCLG